MGRGKRVEDEDDDDMVDTGRHSARSRIVGTYRTYVLIARYFTFS